MSFLIRIGLYLRQNNPFAHNSGLEWIKEPESDLEDGYRGRDT